MKTITAIFLIAATTSALNLSTVIQNNVEIKDLYPKLTAEEWNGILNQEQTEEKYDDFKPGTETQPENAGRSRALHSSRIINGINAVRGLIPWQALIIADKAWLCGGSLIGLDWVLTAGHCTYGLNSFDISLGLTILNGYQSGVVVITTKTKIVHPNYNPSTISNDIALLKLSRSVTPTLYIGVVQLPRYSMANLDLTGNSVIVSGWGKTSDKSSVSPNLQYVKLILISNNDCARIYGKYITIYVLCTSGAGPKGTCNGDSGGPLTYLENGRYTLIGVVSFGAAAGCTLGYPAAYTKVASYLKWISTNTNIAIRS